MQVLHIQTNQQILCWAEILSWCIFERSFQLPRCFLWSVRASLYFHPWQLTCISSFISSYISAKMQECSMPISTSFSLHNHPPEILLLAQSSHRAELVYQGSWYREEGAEGWKRARAGTAHLFYGGRYKGNVLVDEEERGKRLPHKITVLHNLTFPTSHLSRWHRSREKMRW